ncbi:ribosomal protein L11 methyltransferase [Paenibacillus sp. J31TS4]|uniref:50S ribosomal protein L11 methyltransferase n=1 Tax=Paenibacillus sp. J31TS4 TaxID=2807195 RepID=UPI001B1A8BED|nr:50S ribosomal protein L11 methyltransferase [Paenibacillus sp. J31TS4]GIP39588.1 ribosomal protein L11 methyltransferase [Paenibacillus sp. J31TS4]
MRWHEITIETTEEAIEMISNFLHELGAGGVSIEESGTLNKQRDTSLGEWYELPLNDIPEGQAEIKGYFAIESEIDAILASLIDSITRLSGEIGIDTGKAAVSVQEVDDEDWANAWKQYFKPVRITERMTIKPSWEEYEPSSDEIILELDPGMAFGTGTHATTALCLRTLESVVKGGEDVIDVGTGSGVLAIAAAKLGARHVLALDLDPVAVSSATENTHLNGLEDRITIRQSDLLGAIGGPGAATVHGEEGLPSVGRPEPIREGMGVRMPVQLVVANILADIILLFVADVHKALETGGLYIASGIITSKQVEVERALEAAGFAIEQRNKEEDWVALVARKL